MKTAFLRICDVVAALTRWVSVGLSMIMVVALIAQIFFRYVVGHALSGSEEIAVLTFSWVVLLLASVGVREGFHVRLTVLVAWLPETAQHWLERVVVAAIGGFGVFLAIGGWSYLEETRGQVSAATRSEEQPSELHSLISNPYDGFWL